MAVARFTLVVDLVGSTVTVEMDAVTVEEATRAVVARHPQASSVTVCRCTLAA